MVTNLISSGLTIRGVGIWVAATAIAWLASLVAGLLLPVIFVKAKVAHARS